jgi:hypothetical protein
MYIGTSKFRMKNLYVVSVFTIGLVPSFADGQELSQGNLVPSIGFTTNLRAVTTNGDVDPGSAGSSVTWDWSQADMAPIITSVVKALPTDSAPNSDSFPDADLVLRERAPGGEQGIYTYLRQDASTCAELGLLNESLLSQIIFFDPMMTSQYPISYGQSFTDDFCGNSDGDTTCGSVTLTFDGYGTMLMPYGNFTSVARLQRHSLLTYSNSPGDTVFVDEWLWYKSGLPYPLAYYKTITPPGYPFGSISEVVDAGDALGIERLGSTSQITVYPNPCADVLNISPIKGSVAYTLTDVFGKVILSGSTARTINVERLTPGLYFLELGDQGRQQAYRVMKR